MLTMEVEAGLKTDTDGTFSNIATQYYKYGLSEYLSLY